MFKLNEGANGVSIAIYAQKHRVQASIYLLRLKNIDHTRTKARSPQTNGICERFNKTILAEFYQVALRTKLYRSIDDLQADLDVWVRDYNSVRTHQRRWCYGKTPMQTFIDMLPVAKEKLLQAA